MHKAVDCHQDSISVSLEKQSINFFLDLVIYLCQLLRAWWNVDKNAEIHISESRKNYHSDAYLNTLHAHLKTENSFTTIWPKRGERVFTNLIVWNIVFPNPMSYLVAWIVSPVLPMRIVRLPRPTPVEWTFWIGIWFGCRIFAL